MLLRLSYDIFLDAGVNVMVKMMILKGKQDLSLTKIRLPEDSAFKSLLKEQVQEK